EPVAELALDERREPGLEQLERLADAFVVRGRHQLDLLRMRFRAGSPAAAPLTISGTPTALGDAPIAPLEHLASAFQDLAHLLAGERFLKAALEPDASLPTGSLQHRDRLGIPMHHDVRVVGYYDHL